jgi:hypothetical protein
MYKFYNNNALGLFENDCTIRAISTATNNSWDDTYEHLSNIARLKGTMMDDREFIIDYLDERYKRIYDIPRTVGEVAGAYPDNILLITMNGHITCSKFGIVLDSFDCRYKKAEFCWIVK